jgi:hypothetical protein
VPLVEQQIDHGEHAVDSISELVGRWHSYGDPSVSDLGFGPEQSLAHGCLGYQECSSHLAGGQPGDGLQRQGNAAGQGESGVAAAEEQFEPVIVIDRLSCFRLGCVVSGHGMQLR